VNLDRYLCARSDRCNKNGGGAMLHVHESLFPVPIDLHINPELFSDQFNIVACQIFCNRQKSLRMLICNIYLVPDINLDKLQIMLDTLSSVVDSFRGKTVICGDFNMPHIDWLNNLADDPKHDMFLSFCLQHGFHQFVTEPTRASHILDLVLANDIECISNVLVCEPVVTCDHSAVYFNVLKQLPSMVKLDNSSQSSAVLYNFGKANYAHMSITLKSINWMHIFSKCLCINDYWLTWWSLIMCVVDKFVPKILYRSCQASSKKLPRHLRPITPMCDCACSGGLTMSAAARVITNTTPNRQFLLLSYFVDNF